MHGGIFKEDVLRISKVLDENDEFLIIGHVDPDGDCIGSMLALSMFISARGKRVHCFTPGGLPGNFRKLPGADAFIDGDAPAGLHPGVVFTLDTPTTARADEQIGEGDGRLVVNIDHHPSNEMYGDVNLVDPGASATAVIVYRLLIELDPDSITREIADCLYLGILLDTGGFRFQNTDAEALRTAGDLVDRGARAYELTREFMYVKKLSTLKLLARALDSLEVHAGGRVAFMTITRDMVDGNGSSMSETEGFIDYASRVDEVVLSALFREVAPEETRVSLRSVNDYDVSKLAAALGGGGHRNAAGLTLTMGVDDAKNVILREFERMLGGEGSR